MAERHQLENGLTVILRESHTARVVAFQAWVNAGSADETEQEAGLAHVHEHMLFKGTARRGVGEIARAVEAAGGDINAWTSFDQTVYHLVMASRDFSVGLDILADALQHSAFDAEELAREKEVILEEIKRTYDSPASRASRAMFSTAFRTHPYRNPVIGTEASVKGFERDDVLAFYEKHYRPENVTLVLVGDFDTAQALPKIREYFGAWTRGDGSSRVARAQEPPQKGLRVTLERDEVREAHLELCWHIPSVSHDDVAALDVLSVVLGQGESSRLVHDLVKQEHLANDAGGYAYTPRDPGLLIAQAQCAPDRVEEVVRRTLAVVYGMCDQRIGEEELEKGRNIIVAESVYQCETVQGQARRLGFFETVAGSLEFERNYYSKVREVTADDVRRVAREYLRPEGLTAALLMPDDVEYTKDQLRAVCAAAGPKPRASAPESDTPDLARFELDNGTVLIVQKDDSVPLVSMRGVFVGGVRFETEETAGIDYLMACMLTSGTGQRDATEIALTVDRWAASLSGASGRNSFGMYGEFLSRDLEPGARLFSECLTDSTYPQDELEKQRSQQYEEIRAREDQPSGVAFDLFASLMWKTHPYRLDARGTVDSLKGLDPAALKAWHRDHYPIGRLHLGVVGDVEVDRVVELLNDTLGATSPTVTLPEVLEEPPHDGPRRGERTLKKAQAHIVLGFPGVRLTDPQRYPLDLLSTVLSGQGGRLFVELRDKKSLAYSVTSLSIEGIDPGYFAVYIGCSPEKVDEAISSIRDELDKARQSKVTDTELQRAKRYLIGAHEIGLQRASSRAALFAFDDAYGVGYDAQRDYAKHVEAVSAGQIHELAGRILDPNVEVLSIVHP